MCFLCCRIDRLILYPALNCLLSISSSFLRTPPPFPVVCSKPLEACFPHGAFPTLSFQLSVLFVRIYPSTPLPPEIHISLPINRFADKYRLSIDNLYDSLCKKKRFRSFFICCLASFCHDRSSSLFRALNSATIIILHPPF